MTVKLTLQKAEKTVAIHLQPANISLTNVASVSFVGKNITNQGATDV